MGRRYGEFAKLHKRLRTEFPGKVLAPLPRKNKSSASSLLSVGGDDDASSVSSISTQGTTPDEGNSLRSLIGMGQGHRRSASVKRSSDSTRASSEFGRESITLYRENQRVSLRAFLRTFLQNEQISHSKAMQEFLTARPIRLNEEEMGDIQRRKEMDKKRIEEQKQFYEIARQRAKELDVYMEKFRRDIVERSMLPQSNRSTITKLTGNADGLTNLFKEIKEKETIDDLTIEYKKFAEWLRIECVLQVILRSNAYNPIESPQPSTIFSLLKIIPQNFLPKLNAYIPCYLTRP